MNLRTPRASSHPGLRRSWTLALVSVIALTLSACGTGSQASDDSSSPRAGGALAIVVTTNILGDVVSEIAGDQAEVTTLMPPGSDPHSFGPSAQQLAEMQEADLVVANGAGLEQQLTDALTAAEEAGVPMFQAIDHVDALAFGGRNDERGSEKTEHSDEHAEEDHSDDEHSDEHAEEDHASAKDEHSDEHAEEDHSDDEHEHGSVDPHFWMDVSRMTEVARALGDEVAEMGGDASAIAGRVEEYAQRLADVDGETKDMLAAVPDGRRKLVTNHEAFGYFADHYGFEIVGTVIPSLSTGAEPSAQDLDELARTIEQEQVSAIFAENTAPDQLAETLAQEVDLDVEVVELYSDSLGEPDSDAPTYIDLLRANAERVSAALSE